MTVTRTSTPKPKVARDKLVFGATMTDHMLEVDWSAEAGWGAPRISPYHALAIDPAASSLHYGVQVRVVAVRGWGVGVCVCDLGCA
jgi:branched-chain amino acid aminotransferase